MTGSEARARLAVLAAALVPLLIWPLGAGQLLHPGPVAALALLCAAMGATLPGRGLHLVTWLQVLLLPTTLAWTATVAVTGVGPSLAGVEPLAAGAYGVVLAAAGLALRTPAFLAVALLTLASTWLAFGLARRCSPSRHGLAPWLFLATLAPLGLAAQGGRWADGLSTWVGVEPRLAVPTLFQLGAAGSALADAVDNRSAAEGARLRPGRDAATARADFQAEPGVAIFLVGESLRHDALLRPGRGPASDQLLARLETGLGLGLRLPDACAGGNSTFASVPKLLSGTAAPDPAAADGRPTLLALAKAAGARTAYVNNHEIWVVPEAGHDWQEKLSTLYASASDQQAIAAVEDFVQRTRAPEGAEGAEAAAPAPRAVLVHLFGQHFPYQARYPGSFFPPEPAGLAAPALDELRYQRAAEFGAHLLLRLAGFLDRLDEPAYLVFTSDHGENLPSDGTGKRYHAGPASGRHDSTVPVLVLWNRAFADTGRPQRLAALARAQPLLAHRDAARAWLRLLGAPGPLDPSPRPLTWGAVRPGAPVGPLPCAALGP